MSDILDNRNLSRWEYSLNFLFPTKCKHVVKVDFSIISQLTSTSDTYPLGDIIMYSMEAQQGGWTKG